MLSTENELDARNRKMVNLTVYVNGAKFQGEIESRLTLAELLREKMNLTGTKLGCNRAECGVCTVLLDGLPVFSCTVLAASTNGRRVETVEGLMSGGNLHPLQRAFIEDDALQCGFCTPGLLMSLKALTEKIANPTVEEVKEAIAGNFCRCGAYPNIFRAAIDAANSMSSAGKQETTKLGNI